MSYIQQKSTVEYLYPTANTTLTGAIPGYLYVVLATGITVTLPTLVNNRSLYLIRNTQTANNFNFTLGVAATGTQKILWATTTAQSSMTLQSSISINNGGGAIFASNGTNWYPITGATYSIALG